MIVNIETCPETGKQCECGLGPLVEIYFEAVVERDGQEVPVSGDSAREAFENAEHFLENDESLGIKLRGYGEVICPNNSVPNKQYITARTEQLIFAVEPKQPKKINKIARALGKRAT